MAGAAVLVHGCHVAKQVHAEGVAQVKPTKLLHVHEKQARRMQFTMMQLRITMMQLRSANFAGCLMALRVHDHTIFPFVLWARLEDGRIAVGVDCHNALGVLHARQVLDCARDADSDVQLRGDHLAGLAYLQYPQSFPYVIAVSGKKQEILSTKTD